MPGSLRLFQFRGIHVFVHWSWALVAWWQIRDRIGGYSSPVWDVTQYLMLFLVVLLHEFGHSLACRQTGGESERIMLWPLGGVAYVKPPPRPGAELWSIAAGPLVNVALVPVFWLLRQWVVGNPEFSADAQNWVHNIWQMNVFLLIFNLLPIYPLDGGQILRALLWYKVGRASSLKYAVICGFAGCAALVGLAIWAESIWIGVVAAFATWTCWGGWKQAKGLAKLETLPRHDGLACPACHEPPLAMEIWACPICKARLDVFSGPCGNCGNSPDPSAMPCAFCRKEFPLSAWITREG